MTSRPVGQEEHCYLVVKLDCVEQWRGNVFWTGGAQNSKIVSTSGGRTDPPFLERTFLRAGHSADLF